MDYKRRILISTCVGIIVAILGGVAIGFTAGQYYQKLLYFEKTYVQKIGK